MGAVHIANDKFPRLRILQYVPPLKRGLAGSGLIDVAAVFGICAVKILNRIVAIDPVRPVSLRENTENLRTAVQFRADADICIVCLAVTSDVHPQPAVRRDPIEPFLKTRVHEARLRSDFAAHFDQRPHLRICAACCAGLNVCPNVRLASDQFQSQGLAARADPERAVGHIFDQPLLVQFTSVGVLRDAGGHQGSSLTDFNGITGVIIHKCIPRRRLIPPHVEGSCESSVPCDEFHIGAGGFRVPGYAHTSRVEELRDDHVQTVFDIRADCGSDQGFLCDGSVREGIFCDGGVSKGILCGRCVSEGALCGRCIKKSIFCTGVIRKSILCVGDIGGSVLRVGVRSYCSCESLCRNCFCMIVLRSCFCGVICENIIRVMFFCMNAV